MFKYISFIGSLIALKRDKMSSESYAILYNTHKYSIDICGFRLCLFFFFHLFYFVCNKFNFHSIGICCYKSTKGPDSHTCCHNLKRLQGFCCWCWCCCCSDKKESMIESKTFLSVDFFFFVHFIWCATKKEQIKCFWLETKTKNKWRTL